MEKITKIIMSLLMLGILVSSSGCVWFGRDHYVKQRMPVLPLPDRPKLARIDVALLKELPDEITTNQNNLMLYAKQLEITIITYNKFANVNNEESGYGD